MVLSENSKLRINITNREIGHQTRTIRKRCYNNGVNINVRGKRLSPYDFEVFVSDADSIIESSERLKLQNLLKDATVINIYKGPPISYMSIVVDNMVYDFTQRINIVQQLCKEMDIEYKIYFCKIESSPFS